MDAWTLARRSLYASGVVRSLDFSTSPSTRRFSSSFPSPPSPFFLFHILDSTFTSHIAHDRKSSRPPRCPIHHSKRQARFLRAVLVFALPSPSLWLASA